MEKILNILSITILLGTGINGSQFKSDKSQLNNFILTCGYDIQHYILQINLPMYNDSLYGHQNIKAIRKSMITDTLILNAAYLDIDSVKVNNKHTKYKISHDSSYIFANINGIKQNECFNLEVFYRGGNFARKGSNRGYYWNYKGKSDTLYTSGYTLSEPSDARSWMPCLDDPYDKADSGCTLYITVPDSFTVASNGLLEDTNNVNGKIIWHWEEASSIATYLMCFTVSRYSIINDTFVTTKGDTVPLQYFVWPEDSASFITALNPVSKIIDFFSTRFHKYPFAKYGMATVYPFNYGGMEHQDITTIPRSWRKGKSLRVMVHEIAHMWFGDMITCGTWADIWLNEGFASYGQAMYFENADSFKIGDYMEQYHWGAKTGNANLYSVYNPPQDLTFDLELTYNKAPWILHMLRGVMGDDKFFNMMQNYCDSFAYSTVLTAEFQNIAEKHYGSSLDWFFKEWLYRPGHPIYNTVIYYNTDSGGNSAWIKIKQSSATGDMFKMPITVTCSTKAGWERQIVWDSVGLVEKNVTTNYLPIEKVVLDPDNWVLKEWFDDLPVMTTFKTDNTGITVFWNKFQADSTCAGYNLYKSADSLGKFDRLNQVIIYDTTYKDTTVKGKLKYYYKLTAVNATDNSYETRQSSVLGNTPVKTKKQ